MQADITPRRKYALTKIESGDYLLPSNDALTVWRIRKYIEGPSTGLDWPKDREVWGLWRWDMPATNSEVYIDIEDWARWQHWDGHFDTRAEAIDGALRHG